MIKSLTRHGNSWALVIDKPTPLFLELTGLEDTAPDEDLVKLTLSVKRGEADKRQIAQCFRDHTRIID